MNRHHWYPLHPQQYRKPGWQHMEYNDSWHPQPQHHLPACDRRVSIVEAIGIALVHVRGLVVKVELEHEQGILVYEVEIITQQGVKYEVAVDVNTGSVVSVELD